MPRFFLFPCFCNANMCTFYFCSPNRLEVGKKVVSDSLGLVDFAIGLVNSVLNLPNG